MEALTFGSIGSPVFPNSAIKTILPKDTQHACFLKINNPSSTTPARRRRKRRTERSTLLVPSAVDGGTVADLSAPVEITWQIAVGALAGITPFIVAGIEFGKRIVAQQKCETCKGSGLVLEDGSYFRCPNCGGFLPWQSWKRFFTG